VTTPLPDGSDNREEQPTRVAPRGVPRVHVVLLHSATCPHWRLASHRIDLACADLADVAVAVEVRAVDDSFGVASPTILVNGRDSFPGGVEGPACRMYVTDAGVEGAPSVAQLVAAIQVWAPADARQERNP